jgi:glucose-6-phosphate 1-epimerase
MSSPAANAYTTTVRHSRSGASCQIHSLGATLTSFKTSAGVEQLFISRDAVLDGTKAIRGGIPICFPIFGPPDPDASPKSTMPQHGFARLNHWTLVSSYDDEPAAGAVFSLKLQDVTAGRGENNPWSVHETSVDGKDCLLTYEVRFEAAKLTTTLTVRNTGPTPFNFNMLLHTYYLVSEHAASIPTKTFVKGLGGYSIADNVSPSRNGQVQSLDIPVVIDGETDCVYIHPQNLPTAQLDIGVGKASGDTVHLDASGMVESQLSPVSCVVWNPGSEKAAALADFGNDQYQDMICVEPGLIGDPILLNPSSEARITQTMTFPTS